MFLKILLFIAILSEILSILERAKLMTIYDLIKFDNLDKNNDEKELIKIIPQGCFFNFCNFHQWYLLFFY